MDLFIIGKFIGTETNLGQQYLRFVVKNWLIGMWIEEASVKVKFDHDAQDFAQGSFYLLKSTPIAYRDRKIFIELKSIRGPL